MKIDIFPHVMPRRYFDRMLQVAPPGMALQKRMSGIPVLVDVEQRLRIMDRYEGYVQVLTLANPPIEVVGSPDASPELARLANDGMAEVVAKHPDRFPGFVASLPMNNPEAAVREIDRAIDDLHATGVQLYTNVTGRALDLPEYQPVFDRWPSATCPSGCTRRAPRRSPTIQASSGRSTTCGGRSAGPTRPPWPWGVWCSRESSIGTPGSGSSPTTWAP